MRLQDRVLLIVGTHDVAAATARLAVEEGATVVLAGSDKNHGHGLVELLESAGGQATFVTTDLACEDAIQSLVGDAIMTFGALDGLVNIPAPSSPGDALGMEADQ